MPHPAKGILTLCYRWGNGFLERSNKDQQSHRWQGEWPGLGQDSNQERLFPKVRLSATVLSLFRKQRPAKRQVNAVWVDGTPLVHLVQEWLPEDLAKSREEVDCISSIIITRRRKQMRRVAREQNLSLMNDFRMGCAEQVWSNKFLSVLFLGFYKYWSAESLGVYSDNYLKYRLYITNYREAHTTSWASRVVQW